jgi:two-component system chemotaxis sensor kinase CheA
LQELGTSIRMVPIAGTFQKMARLVRDLSRKSGKTIVFQTRGDETELDRAFVDKIADPLVHMIRNAVDHGIELPGERAATGKPPDAVIELRAFHEGGNIHVEIRDDGRGLNRDAIWNKALEKGLVQPDERLSESEIFNLIFLPGFSTAKVVTEVSGRGVGMDVVKRNIEELRGYVQIQSTLGKGTKFKIILPLTLALIDGMIVRVGRERYIFPVLNVVESLRPTAGMVISLIGKGEMLSLRNRQVPLFRLGKLFGIAGVEQDATKSLAVIVEHEGRQAGLLVDDLIGMQQTVIKSLGSGLGHNAGFSGGAIMADGRVGLIVDVSGVMKIARGEVGRVINPA